MITLFMRCWRPESREKVCWKLCETRPKKSRNFQLFLSFFTQKLWISRLGGVWDWNLNLKCVKPPLFAQWSIVYIKHIRVMIIRRDKDLPTDFPIDPTPTPSDSHRQLRSNQVLRRILIPLINFWISRLLDFYIDGRRLDFPSFSQLFTEKCQVVK